MEGQYSSERPRALFVDDDALLRERAAMELEMAGFVVSQACNGDEAISLVRSTAPDVILVDVDLRDTDGFELCSAIRSMPEARSTPVVLATALDDAGTVARCFDAGAADVVQRPILWTVVSRRLRRLATHRRAEERIRELAQFDALTGLPNRLTLLELLEGILLRDRRSDKCTAVLCLDIDRFAELNATVGEIAGDWLLKRFADRLRATLRRSDCVTRGAEISFDGALARPGGDRFIVVLSALESAEGAARAAERVHVALREPFRVEDREVYLSAAIGVALQPSDGPDPAALLQRAEIALRFAKKKPRTLFYFYDPSMHSVVRRTLEMAGRLHKALEREELFLCYQPLVECGTRRVVGVEALLRWNHPELGLVPPSEFIPVAEDTGVMPAIGEWVLRTACRQVREWHERGLERLRLAVNLSACQLRDPGFASKVAEVLEESGLEPCLLDLELTERGVLPGDGATLQCLTSLKAIGVRLAVDDFGTGNSSLGYLKLFPLDVVKIDRSYIDRIHDDSSHTGLVAGIIALAHRARLSVVAEGVETEDQLGFLERERCDEVQGFLFAKPLLAEELPALVSRRRRACTREPLG